MKQLVWKPILATLVVAAICGVAWADGTAPAAKVPAPTPAPATTAAPGTSPYKEEFVQGNDFDKWCESIKKPCNWFNWGGRFPVPQRVCKQHKNDHPGCSKPRV